MRRSPSIAVVPIIAAVGILAFLTLRGGGDDYVVYAKFRDAGGILKNYNVKVGQVKAGSVKAITLDGSDNAVVKMVLDKSAVPVGAGASANVRPVNLLGERYIELDPGDLERPVPSGSVIPRSRTSAAVELDDVLNVLDPDTRGALRIVINEAGLAMAGHGADFNSVLQDLPPALGSARRLVREVARENATLDRLIVSGDRVLASIVARRSDLTRLVSSAAGALTTVAQRREQLGATVSNAPGALANLRRTLGKLQAAAHQLTPAAADLRAAEPALASTLRRLPQFARDANGALTTATKVAPTLRRLGRQSLPTLRRLRPAADRLATFSGDLRPFMHSADTGKGLFEFLDFMAGWASTTKSGDGLGHVFRLGATIDQQIIESAARRYSAGLTQPTSSRPNRREKRRPSALAPLTNAPGPGRKLELPKVRAPKVVPPAVGKVLDDAQDDVRSLLNYLLGP